MTAKRKPTTTRLIDQKPKLKKLVAQFQKDHQKFSNDVWRATYRHLHAAAKLGAMLLEMMQEGGFKSLRELHIWLESECGSSIPQRSFYRYVNAAEDVKTVEVVHGTKMLTEVSSIKTLKMLARPRIPPEPHEAPKPALNEPPPQEWNGQNIRHPAANGAVKDARPKRDGDVRMEETPKTPEQTFAQTIIHAGCKDFQIENDRTLSCTDQHGDRIMVTSEKAHIGTLLDKAVSRYRGKQRKGASRAPHSR